MIHVIQQRLRYRKDRTPSEVFVNGERFCFAVEDELRELPGVPVEQWKVKARTAAPAGIYNLKLVNSPRFGKETLALEPEFGSCGFTDLRVHGGNDEGDTEGCPLVGSVLDNQDRIPGGHSQPALKALKALLVPALKAGEEVVWEIRNPPGYNGPTKESAT